MICLPNAKKKVHHPPLLSTLRPVVASVNINLVTKGYERHVSEFLAICCMTDTHNKPIPSPWPPLNGCFPQPQTHQFISDTVMTNYKPFLCLEFSRVALVGAPHAACLEMKGWREPSCCQKQAAHTTNNAALRATIDHMVALSWTLCQHYIV